MQEKSAVDRISGSGEEFYEKKSRKKYKLTSDVQNEITHQIKIL